MTTIVTPESLINGNWKRNKQAFASKLNKTEGRQPIFCESAVGGEEQQLGFVVLPKLKIDDAMLDSTWLARKPREEQQQMQGKLLFYHYTKNAV